MHTPKYSPRRPRVLDHFIFTFILLLGLVCVQSFSLAHAAQLEPEPGNLEQDSRVDDVIGLKPNREHGNIVQFGDKKDIDREEGGYLGDFAYLDRSFIGRAVEGVETLQNNEVVTMETGPDESKNFVLEISGISARNSEIVGEEQNAELTARENSEEQHTADEGTEQSHGLNKRQGQKQVYITVNTCRQPGANAATLLLIEDPPQLTLYVSNSVQNQKPGAGAMNNLATDPIPFNQGFANFTLNTTSDVFIGISAPKLTMGWEGSWSFEIAASIDGYYHSSSPAETFLFLVDSDYDSALFVTSNLTANVTADIQKWTSLSASPFTMFAFPEDKMGANGLKRSWCGLKQIANTTNITTANSTITTNFGSGLPRGQFHVDGLEKNKQYLGYLAIDGNITTQGMNFPVPDSLGRGGRVWMEFKFRTKVLETCQVIFGLEFCNEIAYAVPSSLQFRNNDKGLATWYDNLARDYYKNFTISLDQIACDTTDTAKYSLARTCDDCRRDYKEWLCSVVIPRCEDYNTTHREGLQLRNVNQALPDGTSIDLNERFYSEVSPGYNHTINQKRTAFNQSRNPKIDKELQPGPYKELLPCEDLCFDIVRSCPAKLGFVCPNAPAMNLTYAKRNPAEKRNVTCNFPGAVTDLNPVRSGAGVLLVRMGGTIFVVGLAVAWALWI